MSAEPTSGPPPIRMEPTLGDILGAILAGESEQMRVQEEQRIAAQAQYLSAWRIADDLAPLLGVQSDEVFNALTHVPDNMLGLLCSPGGWSSLAEYAAGVLGKPSPRFKPAVH